MDRRLSEPKSRYGRLAAAIIPDTFPDSNSNHSVVLLVTCRYTECATAPLPSIYLSRNSVIGIREINVLGKTNPYIGMNKIISEEWRLQGCYAVWLL
jgi:hypothetical protein